MYPKNYEFKADLKDHMPNENSKIFRLYYEDYYRTPIGSIYGIDWPFKPFMLPDNMNMNDALKILSYLKDFIARLNDLDKNSYKTIKILDNVLNLERLGFKRDNISCEENYIVNLFTVQGRLLLFKKSDNYKKYFNWYKENITFDEVKEIYQNIGIDFYDLVPKIENEEKETKVRVRE